MFIICYNMPLNKVDEKIEILQINEIYNAFYESPLEITTDENGYGYIEKEDELTTLKVAFDGEEEDLEGFKDKVSHLINETPINVYEENYNYNDFSLPAINIDENWVLASPDEEIEGKNKINFIKVFVGDALSNEVNIEGEFDWIYINIGGEETHMFMNFIKAHLKDNGTLLVSGLVEWSFDNIKSMVECNGFNMIEKHQSNEWVTAIFN